VQNRTIHHSIIQSFVIQIVRIVRRSNCSSYFLHINPIKFPYLLFGRFIIETGRFCDGLTHFTIFWHQNSSPRRVLKIGHGVLFTVRCVLFDSQVRTFLRTRRKLVAVPY